MMGRVIARLRGWFARWLGRRPGPPRYKLVYVEGDELPRSLAKGTLIVAREGKDLWAAGMICPCGCGRRLEMMLLDGVEPRWELSQGAGGPSLRPSVWARDGCRSHFWLTDGVVNWCRD